MTALSNSTSSPCHDEMTPHVEVIRQVAASEFLTPKETGRFLLLATNRELQIQLGGKTSIMEIICKAIVSQTSQTLHNNRPKRQSNPSHVVTSTKSSTKTLQQRPQLSV